jgi:uncharacterized membrane protein
MTRDAREQIAIVLALTVAGFVMVSLIVLFVLALNGNAPDDVWGALFALVTAVLGALAGYLGGTAMAARNGKHPEA